MKWYRFWSLAVSLVLALGSGCTATEDHNDDSPADDDQSSDNDTQSDDDATTDDDVIDDDTEPAVYTIDRATLEDKILGSWVGQMAGVAWAASTEFDYHGRIIPAEDVPDWRPGMVNQGFVQDDLYVEIPFLETMVDSGPTVSWTVFGEGFRDTIFPLWHANDAARDNLRAGIPAPASGHYADNEHADDLDWQIEADFIGAICPGRPNEAIDIAWRAGHVMTFGDGTLGGIFLAAMHSAAFFATSLDEIIATGRDSLPAGSKYRQVIDDVLGWYEVGLSWEDTWQQLQDKWGNDDRCPSYDNIFMRSYNIDAKLNGAYVLIGLLYGDGDLTESMRIAMRCGQDSDCNASSAGGILGNWYGLSGIPVEYQSALNPDLKFLFTSWTLTSVIEHSLALARQIVLLAGGEVTGVGDAETWTIPRDPSVDAALLEQWPATANEAPVLTAEVVSQSGQTVEFNAIAADDDGVADYQWFFGDLQRESGSSISHTYAAAGTYEVIAYVADAVGNTSWQTLTVTVP